MATSTHFDASTISAVAAKESAITGSPRPVKNGPTAQAQKHTGETIDGEGVAAVLGGEKTVTGEDVPRAGGPTAFVQSLASKNAGNGHESTVSNLPELPISCYSISSELTRHLAATQGHR